MLNRMNIWIQYLVYMPYNDVCEAHTSTQMVLLKQFFLLLSSHEKKVW
jgi:hypothetical protein